MDQYLTPPLSSPPTDADIEVLRTQALIERAGFLDYEYVEAFDLSQLQGTRRVQVRDSAHYAPPETVKAYAAMIEVDPKKLGPIIVSEDHFTIDGNTRERAAKKAHVTTFHAFVVKEAMEGATPAMLDRFAILAAMANQMHGQRLTESENRRQAVTMVRAGLSNAAIQKNLGLNSTAITNVRKDYEVEKKLTDLGMKVPKGLKTTVFGTTAILGLHDEPFRKLFSLVIDAGLKTPEVNALVKDVVKAGSDAKQIELLALKRTEMAQRIADHALTGNGQPPKSSQLKRTLGQIVSLEGYEKDCVDKSPDPTVREGYVKQLKRAVAVLTAILRMQGGVQ